MVAAPSFFNPAQPATHRMDLFSATQDGLSGVALRHFYFRRLGFALTIVGVLAVAAALLVGRMLELDDMLPPHILGQIERLAVGIFAVLTCAILLLVWVGLGILRPALRALMDAQGRQKHLQQLKHDFLSTVSHEIRTPMNGIFGMAEMLQDSNLTAEQHGYVANLIHAADNLLALLDDVLDLSRLESGRLELDDIPFDLLEVMEDVAEHYAPMARHKTIELLVRLSPEVPRQLVGDPRRLRQILSNLVCNAVKFTREGCVLVQADAAETNRGQGPITLRLMVEDTGPGISEAQQASIFDTFILGDASDARKHGGMGLGLAIVQKLVNLMGGQIGLESALGHGACFSVVVPLKVDQNQPLPAIEATALKGKRILLVDDLAPNRAQISEMLQQHGADITLAEDGDDALHRLFLAQSLGQRIELLITDYLMPNRDGESLCKAVRAEPRFAELPILLLSSAGELGYATRFAKAGASAFLAKPLRAHQLIATTALLLSGHAQAGRCITAHESQTAVQQQNHTTTPLEGARILLVEDNRINREFTSELLRQMGCHVTCAEDGAVALERVYSAGFDLIIMDCQMPVMDGFEATEKLTELMRSGELPYIPILALTANAMEGDRERCLSAGMQDYLTKPVRRQTLQTVLTRWLEVRNQFQTPTPPTLQEALMLNYPDLPLDVAQFDETRQLAGDKFSMLLGFFLEDTHLYMAQLENAVATAQTEDAARLAHTVKSSAKQFGLMRLSEPARLLEEAARAHMAHSSKRPGNEASASGMEPLQPLAEALSDAFAQAQPILQRYLSDAGGGSAFTTH